jgi:2'-5' RNA ligase
MDLREAINNLLRENIKQEYGCVMLFFDFPKLKQIHKLIDKKDLCIDKEDPLENYPHVTLLYGLHEEVTTLEVEEVIKNYKFTPLKLYNPSLFEKDEYDVLKFEVGYQTKGGNYLRKINKELSNFPHTNDYPNYQPHSTIAYIKPGLGQKYVDLLNKNQQNEYELTPEYVIYSKSDGTQEEIKIN